MAPCGRGRARMGAPYHDLPRPQTKPKTMWSCMWNPLPILTNCIAILCSRSEPIGGFGLVTPAITRAYHRADLAGPPLCCAITNHYRPRVKYTHNDRNSHILHPDSGPRGIRLIPTASTQEVIPVTDGGAKHRLMAPPTEPHRVADPHAAAKVHTVVRTPHPRRSWLATANTRAKQTILVKNS